MCFSAYFVLVLQVIVFLWCSFRTEFCADIGQGKWCVIDWKSRESQGILFWKICMSPASSVSTGPGPGPGPLRPTSLWFGLETFLLTGLGACIAFALLVLFISYKPHFTSAT